MPGHSHNHSGIAIVLVEDIRLLADSIAPQLRKHGMRVSATARNGPEAVEAARRWQPRAILMDAASGSRGGPDVVEALRRVAPDACVVVMDLLPRRADVVAYIRAGAVGFVSRDDGIREVAATLHAVTAGERVLPRSLTPLVFDHIAAERPRSRGADAVNRLTPRERQVCDLVADGLSNKEVGARLHIARHTVKTHVHNVLEKLSLRSRVQVARAARDGGGFSRRRRRGIQGGI